MPGELKHIPTRQSESHVGLVNPGSVPSQIRLTLFSTNEKTNHISLAFVGPPSQVIVSANATAQTWNFGFLLDDAAASQTSASWTARVSWPATVSSLCFSRSDTHQRCSPVLAGGGSSSVLKLGLIWVCVRVCS